MSCILLNLKVSSQLSFYLILSASFDKVSHFLFLYLAPRTSWSFVHQLLISSVLYWCHHISIISQHQSSRVLVLDFFFYLYTLTSLLIYTSLMILNTISNLTTPKCISPVWSFPLTSSLISSALYSASLINILDITCPKQNSKSYPPD